MDKKEPNEAVCCPKFDPKSWDEKTVEWKNKPFIKDTVRCFLHMPLNMGSVIKRMWAKVEGTDAEFKDPKEFLMLSYDPNMWKSEQYMSVKSEVEGVENVKISGKFMTKVFEGPYRDAGKWYKEMINYVEAKGKKVEKIYFYYTTCPKCAKKYGKNYVVAFAQVK